MAANQPGRLERYPNPQTRNLAEQLCFADSAELDAACRLAISNAVGQVMCLAHEVLGVDDDDIEALHQANLMFLVPPSAGGRPVQDRMVLQTMYGQKQTSQAICPSIDFLRQILIGTQICFDRDVYGFEYASDLALCRQEAIEFSARYGTGLHLYDILEARLAPGRQVVAENDRDWSRASFASGMATALSLAQVEGELVERRPKFRDSLPMAHRAFLDSRIEEGRADRYGDVYTRSLLRPMTIEECQKLIDCMYLARKPQLHLV